jgi:hypothetical protein
LDSAVIGGRRERSGTDFEPRTGERESPIIDRETGRPRRFGCVEISSGDAACAMGTLNVMDFEGCSPKMDEAQERSGGEIRSGPRRR